MSAAVISGCSNQAQYSKETTGVMPFFCLLLRVKNPKENKVYLSEGFEISAVMEFLSHWEGSIKFNGRREDQPRAAATSSRKASSIKHT